MLEELWAEFKNPKCQEAIRLQVHIEACEVTSMSTLKTYMKTWDSGDGRVSTPS